MAFESVYCQNCGKVSTAEAFPVGTEVDCEQCGNHFTVSESGKERQPPKPPPEMPAGIKLVTDEAGLQIVCRWAPRGGYAFTAVAAVCLLAAGGVALSDPKGLGDMLGLFVTMLALGVAGVFGAVLYFVNRTFVRVADGWLTVTQAPIPWLGNLKEPFERVEQFQAMERSNENGTWYQVDVVLEGWGGSKKLVSGIYDEDQAEYIAALLNEYFETLRDGKSIYD